MTDQAMTHPIERASVEQADREAAAEYLYGFNRKMYADHIKETLRGYFDLTKCVKAFARHRQQARDAGFAEGNAWHSIDSAPMWQVAIVTDGENVALAQKAKTDFDGFYWAIDPEDALEWEPTHWVAPPALSAEANEERCDAEGGSR